jgi:hypothetical protein
VTVTVYDSSGFGQSAYALPSLLVVGSTAAVTADALAADTLAAQVGVFSSVGSLSFFLPLLLFLCDELWVV